MYIPAIYRFLAPALSLLPSKPAPENALDDVAPAHLQHDDQSATLWDPCPKMTIRCVKDGVWPQGILGNIGQKEFCREGWRCNQCDIEANTDECNLKFEECNDLCQAFAPLPF
ncbi:hypothetical protein B0J17DRAFT_438662 [Rhizoctonia solani]|nr:hypothetical protein B0J17DRAFT_438662 [Rhizoctonia solani]